MQNKYYMRYLFALLFIGVLLISGCDETIDGCNENCFQFIGTAVDANTGEGISMEDYVVTIEMLFSTLNSPTLNGTTNFEGTFEFEIRDSTYRVGREHYIRFGDRENLGYGVLDYPFPNFVENFNVTQTVDFGELEVFHFTELVVNYDSQEAGTLEVLKLDVELIENGEIRWDTPRLPLFNASQEISNGANSFSYIVYSDYVNRITATYRVNGQIFTHTEDIDVQRGVSPSMIIEI